MVKSSGNYTRQYHAMSKRVLELVVSQDRNLAKEIWSNWVCGEVLTFSFCDQHPEFLPWLHFRGCGIQNIFAGINMVLTQAT